MLQDGDISFPWYHLNSRICGQLINTITGVSRGDLLAHRNVCRSIALLRREMRKRGHGNRFQPTAVTLCTDGVRFCCLFHCISILNIVLV